MTFRDDHSVIDLGFVCQDLVAVRLREAAIWYALLPSGTATFCHFKDVVSRAEPEAR